jgi:hypothetical protein
MVNRLDLERCKRDLSQKWLVLLVCQHQRRSRAKDLAMVPAANNPAQSARVCSSPQRSLAVF